MLTIMLHAKIKQAYLDEFLDVAALLTRETRNKRKGCISYSFNQRIDSPTEFILYEQWESQADLDEHIRQLSELLGPPKHGQQLPEKLLKMYESGMPYYYKVIE